MSRAAVAERRGVTDGARGTRAEAGGSAAVAGRITVVTAQWAWLRHGGGVVVVVMTMGLIWSG